MIYQSDVFESQEKFLETFNIVMDNLITNVINPNNIFYLLDKKYFYERKRVNTVPKLITSAVNRYISCEDNSVILDSGVCYPFFIVQNYSLRVYVNTNVNPPILEIHQIITEDSKKYIFKITCSSSTALFVKLQNISFMQKQPIDDFRHQSVLEKGDAGYIEGYRFVTQENVFNHRLSSHCCSLQTFNSYEDAVIAGIYYRRLARCVPELQILTNNFVANDIQTWNLDYIKKRWNGVLKDEFRSREVALPDYMFASICPDISKKYSILGIVVNTKYEYVWILVKEVALRILPLSVFIQEHLDANVTFIMKKFKKKLYKCFDKKSGSHKQIRDVIKKEIRTARFTITDSNCRI